MEMNTPDVPPIAAPPTLRGELRTGARPSQWPVVIGVLAIIFGALGALSRAGGMAMMFLVRSFADSLDPDALEMMGPFSDEWLAWSVAEYTLGAMLAVVLLIGGIGLVRRKRWSISVILAWAWVKIIFVLGEALLQAFISRHQLEVARAQSGAAMSAWAENAMLVAGVMQTLVFGLALPIVCLVFLRLEKARREVECWR